MELLHNIRTFFSTPDADGGDAAKVRMSSSGQFSVDVAELVKTKRFQKDLETTRKIAALAAKG